MAYVAFVDACGELASGASSAVVPWWSFTKTLIAVCVLRLAESGRLALDERVLDHPFTPRELLQHRAGVGNYGDLAEYHAAVERGEDAWSDDDLLARVPAKRLLFAPGMGWAYSNVGYMLLRQLIERASGESFATALKELVLRRLGVEDASVALTRTDMSRTAFAGAHSYDPSWVYHGLVIGPVREAALALHRILEGRLLSASSRAAMLDRHPLGGPIEGRPWVSTGYGLGLMIGTMRSKNGSDALTVAGHTAGGPGSVGAVYHAAATGRTAAAFAPGADDSSVEETALHMLLSR
jgi:CubicO group peptidase (beta-lactamase class C family)